MPHHRLNRELAVLTGITRRYGDSLGGWGFSPGPHDGTTTATWRYTFSCKPPWLAGLAHAIGTAVLGRDIRRRIHAFATACTDPEVLAEARRQSALTP